jgi:hypothetical protein
MWRNGLFFVVIMAFLGTFGWAYVNSGPSTPVAQTSTESGLYENYAFTITSTVNQKQKSAIFNPAVKGDDSEVVAALRELMHTSYGEVVPDDLQPVVETVKEHNYITFTLGDSKAYFQLFKNSAGELGSVTFWQDGPAQSPSLF